VRILRVNGDPKSLLGLSGQDLDSIRALMLKPLNTTFHGPNEVGLYLFADGVRWSRTSAPRSRDRTEWRGIQSARPGWVARWK